MVCLVAGERRCFGLFCGLLPSHPVVLPHVLHWLVWFPVGSSLTTGFVLHSVVFLVVNSARLSQSSSWEGERV